MIDSLEQQNYEALHDEFSEHTARQNLEWYLKSIGMPQSPDDIWEGNLRIMASVPLHLLSDRLDFSVPAQSDRDKEVAFFEQDGWLPASEAEMSWALPDSVKRTMNHPPKTNVDAPEEDWSIAIDYFDKAKADNDLLEKVGALRSGRPVSSGRWLRGNQRALYLIADNLVAREALDRGYWPQSESLELYDRQSFWRGFMLFASRYADDESLTKLLGDFSRKMQKKEAFMSRRYEYAKAVLGSGQAEELEARRRQASTPQKPTHNFSRPDSAPLTDYSAKQARIDTHAEQSSSPHAAALRELGGEALRNESGEEIESFDPQDRRPSAHAWGLHRDRREKSRRVSQANARRRYDGISDKAKGEIS